MSDIRELPEQTPRVETGPTRFGDDWTGVFIRGDNAFGFCMYLDIAIAHLREKGCTDDALLVAQIQSLRDLLARSNEAKMRGER